MRFFVMFVTAVCVLFLIKCMYILYACCFLLPTFPPEIDPWQGGLGNSKLTLVGWSGCGPTWQVRNLNQSLKSFKRNDLTLGCSRHGEETFPYLKNPVYSVWKYLTLPVEIPHPTRASTSMYIHTYKFQNPHPIKARFKFSTSRRPFVSNSLVSRHGRVKYPWVVRAG